MADMERIIVRWAGVSGLPGLSVFYGDVAGSANADLKTFFTAIAQRFPVPLTWQIPGSGDLIDDVSGTLSGTWVNGAGGGIVAATGAAQYAAGVGAYVNWRTGAVVGTRRLMGRTYLAPLINSAYDSSGNIVTGDLNALQAAATALVTAGSTRVWHRPGAVAGSSHQPIGAEIPDQVTSLRTRRR